MTHDQYIKQRSEQFLDELKQFLRIPSVSARPEHHVHILEAAAFLRKQLQEAGMDRIETFQMDGNPIIYAEKKLDASLPTVLIYGHYDVQPAEPLHEWVSPPFEPEIRDGNIYARGACDDKAQVLLVIKAVETLIKSGTACCNIKLLFEGEEETGSVSLERFITENKQLLRTDAFLVCDTSMPDPEHPLLITGLRGICYWELSLTTANEDLHSGMFGGVALNAANELCSLIAAMKDEKGKVRIPGFYDGLHAFDDLPTDQEMLLTEFPSLDVNGITSGYSGNGPKTVIPAQASAKLSSRLAPGQEFYHVHQCMEAFVRGHVPANTTVALKLLVGHNAVLTQITTPEFASAERALEKHFGTQPRSQKIGGTIPVVSMMQRHLNVNPVLMGFGLDSDNIHAPNEHFLIDNYYKGMYTLLDFFADYGKTVHDHKQTLIHTTV